MKQNNFFMVAECSENDYNFLKSVFKYVAVGDVGLGDRLIGFSNVPKSERKFIKFFEFEKAKDLDLYKMQTQYLFNVKDSELPELIKYFRLTLMGKETRYSEEEIIGWTNSLTPDFGCLSLFGVLDDYEQAWTVNNQTGLRQILKMRIEDANVEP